MHDADFHLNRRALIAMGALAGPAMLMRFDGQAPDPTPAPPGRQPAAPRPSAVAGSNSLGALDPALLSRALAALDAHHAAIQHRDRIAIVDFSEISAKPRLHVVDTISGQATPYLVAHGAGSDPGHTGFLHRFSNRQGSNASSEGAFVTTNYYVGKHGRSQRLVGLDPTNNNALARAIVVHGAWYAEPGMIPAHGKLGRSQGCFAVGDSALGDLFEQLGEGRLIYAAKA